jgi:hypothetical protein
MAYEKYKHQDEVSKSGTDTFERSGFSLRPFEIPYLSADNSARQEDSLNYNRISTTGILAVLATALFALLIHGVAGLRQAEPNCFQTVKVLPQIPLGSFDGGLTRYSTVIQIVNTSGTTQSVTATFYKEDGTPLENPTLTAGTSTIMKDGVLVIGGEGTEGSGVIGWGKITACGALSLSTFFELRDANTNVLLSRVAVAASPANMSSFVIPRIREVGTGLDVGFALVNTATSGSATLTAELKDSAGRTVAIKDIPMTGGAHRAGFTKDLFAPLNEAKDRRTYQYVKFSSSSPTFAAIALAFEGSTQTSFPAEPVR